MMQRMVCDRAPRFMEMGMPVAELIRRVGISEQTFYRWKKQFTGLEIDQSPST